MQPRTIASRKAKADLYRKSLPDDLSQGRGSFLGRPAGTVFELLAKLWFPSCIASSATWVFADSDAGEIKIVPDPAGTRGYEDLRFRANRERLGHGVRPSVASPGDLVRMMEALDRQPDPLVVLETMRGVLELERRLTIER